LGTRPGPSLGDAFLDAGAAAVIQSGWDVGNRETAAFMRAFLAESRAGAPPATALARARRAIMAAPEGASPRVWAAWSANLLWSADQVRGAPPGGPLVARAAIRPAPSPPASP
jgi:hypothetical protein